MAKNKFILILSIFVLLLSLNIISASDTDNVTTDIKKIQGNAITAKDNVKQAQHNVFYVDSKSAGGNGSKGNPYNTINDDNLGKMSENSTVYVAKGRYLINSTKFNKNISIIGENRDEVIFVPSGSSSAFFIEKQNRVVLKNFTLRDFQSDSNPAITNNGTLLIENLNLINNVGTTTKNNGGSIINNGNLTVKNTIFEKNMASFGAAIYNTASMSIVNSTFDENSIYNVGGAIYSIRGNATVYDSVFRKNRAVSGAAIYNAFGYLYVDNTDFIENNAEHFFGGAIYSTGITVTNNSLFDSNHANMDGGAITTTNNFTIINSTFVENYANENGGAIENVPWSENENGNLTIINSTFTENSASKGGVIINYGKVESVGDPAKVTARGCLFDSNTADIGGVIYNEQYVDMENNAFIDNSALECNVIYTLKDSLIDSINANWWGTNNPRKEDIGALPDNWVVMNFTSKSNLRANRTLTLIVSLNTLSNGKKISESLPLRKVIFSAKASRFDKKSLPIYSIVKNRVYYSGDVLSARIDGQRLTLKATRTAIKITINPVRNAKYKDSILIAGKFMDVNGKVLKNSLLNLNINGKKVNVKTDSSGVYRYSFKNNLTGTNNVSVSYHGNDLYNANTSSYSFNVSRRGVVLLFDKVSVVRFKENVTVTGRFCDDSGHGLLNSNVRITVNDKSVLVKTGSAGRFSYTFKALCTGVNNISASYMGNNNYGANSTGLTFKVLKQYLRLSITPIKNAVMGDSIRIKGKLTDRKGHPLMNSNVKIKLNNNSFTVKTNAFGEYSRVVKVNVLGINYLTVSHMGNSNYVANSTGTTFVVSRGK
ncbi:MAG: hypothetical protein BZ138_03930 [Methanosphaera sp. rholeuAM270]|nr:MAG: hypothetical protein BZ138_03930 [Methanosphaera sp. rholeuAM270]